MRELAQNRGQSVSEITADLYSRLISGQRFFGFRLRCAGLSQP